MTNEIAPVTDKQFSAALRLIHIHADILDFTNGRLRCGVSAEKLVREYRLLVKQTGTLICSPSFMASLDQYLEMEAAE